MLPFSPFWKKKNLDSRSAVGFHLLTHRIENFLTKFDFLPFKDGVFNSVANVRALNCPEFSSLRLISQSIEATRHYGTFRIF